MQASAPPRYPDLAFRIAYAGEQSFELHLPFSYRLSLWDLLLVLRLRHYGVSSA